MTAPLAAATPTIDDMVERAQALLPALRSRAAQTEALGRLPDETVQAFRDGGFFRVLQPRRFGGYELDYGRLRSLREARPVVAFQVLMPLCRSPMVRQADACAFEERG
jgi:alkylation response protein AidB-like acyl-CoA dehydrogenase